MFKSLFAEFAPKGKVDEESKRFEYINAAYLIGVFFVILGHSHPLDESWSGTWLNGMNAFLYSFHMHLYFFVAGYLLVHSKSIEQLGYKKWALNKLLKFGIPYILLTILAFYPKAILDNTSDAVELSLEYFLKTTFLVPRLGVWGHFWFIAAYLPIDLIWGLWRYYSPKSKFVYRFGLVFGFLVSIILAILPLNTDVLTLYDISEVAIFYSIGILCAILKPFLWNRIYKLIISIPITLTAAFLLYPYGNYENYRGKSLTFINLICGKLDGNESIFDSTLINFIVSMCFVWTCWCIALLISKVKWFKLPAFVSKYVFNIFVYAWPAQAAIEALLSPFSLNVYLVSAIMFVVGFAAPILIVYIYKKLKFIHCRFFDYLIGVNTVSISHKGDIKS